MKYLYLFIFSFILISCNGGDNTFNGFDFNKNYKSVDKKIYLSQDKELEYIKNVTHATIELTIPQGESKDIYLVTTSHFNNQEITISSSLTTPYSLRQTPTQKEKKRHLITPNKVVNFNAHLPKKKHSQKKIEQRILSQRVYTQEQQERFFVEYFNSSGNSDTYEINATAKKVISNINTPYGKKTLVIWVANSEFDDETLLSNGTISQTMIDELADIFLKDGEDNDIYEWDTNLYGAEWGDDARSYDSSVIANENTIHILIYDMQIDTLAGFFYAKDNYLRSSEPSSNEKIMFYVNARLYGKGDEASKKETFTTLVHEFQHMINFYQRWLKKDIQDPTWFNEMLSETTEDIIATKIKYYGPRNVDPDDGSAGESGNRGGRYPYFNKYNYYPVTSWFGDIDDYGRASAFGAFLIRNYGGAQFLHNLFNSNTTGREALVKITQEKDFNTILNRWGAAVMLSDKIDLAQDLPQYNFGDFKETTLNNITYKMGSINFFNYIPKPTFKDEITAYKDANIYTKIGENLSGKVLISVDIEKGGDVTIIAK